VALDVDLELRILRFNLVPHKMTEEDFWRSYFYRVSIIRKQFEVEQLGEYIPTPAKDKSSESGCSKNLESATTSLSFNKTEEHLVNDNLLKCLEEDFNSQKQNDW